MARSTKKAPEEHPFYHDTWKLLKNYRDVAWNLEIADLDLQAEVRAEYGTAEGGSLAALTEAGADLHGTRIESFARSLERSRRMMQLLDAAIQLMRRRHKRASCTTGCCTTPTCPRRRMAATTRFCTLWRRISRPCPAAPTTPTGRMPSTH